MRRNSFSSLKAFPKKCKTNNYCRYVASHEITQIIFTICKVTYSIFQVAATMLTRKPIKVTSNIKTHLVPPLGI